MADTVTLTDLAFAVGLLTAIVSFYARFIRPSVVSTIEWRKDMERRVGDLSKDIERHGRTDQELLTAVKSQGKDLVEIKTKLAVLEERSRGK